MTTICGDVDDDNVDDDDFGGVDVDVDNDRKIVRCFCVDVDRLNADEDGC